MALTYTDTQKSLIASPLETSIFLEGASGCGKTSAALGRMEKLLQTVPGHQILVLVPQRSLGKPYQKYFEHHPGYRGSLPSILTLGGLARRMLSLFWPLAALPAGFADPRRPPVFLSLETAQYCMAKIVDPKLEKGFFDAVTIDRNRIYSQVIDNLNKAAVVRFPLEEIAARLKSDLNLDPALAPALEHAQTCALEFRDYCLQHNLLDYSLQIEVFLRHVWPLPLCRDYFQVYFPHVIFDNIEEDVPAAHDLVRDWLPNTKSTLLILDRQGGYRTFLGADPESALALQPLCRQHITFAESLQPAGEVSAFQSALGDCIRRKPASQLSTDFSTVLEVKDFHFYPEMLAGVASEISRLITSGEAQAGEIVVLAPYLSDALKFSLTQLLEGQQVPCYTSRPSRMYLDQPAVRCMLTFAKLAHPHWELKVPHFELRDALMQALPGLDIIRADLIAQTLYSPAAGLKSFDALTNPHIQERITFAYGQKVEKMRDWLGDYANRDPLPLDIFLSCLFGELLSQKGFGLFEAFEAGAQIAQLIFSIKAFRQFLASVFGMDDVSAGMEFIRTLEAGLLPAVFHSRDEPPEDAVLIAPAHTFLMENRQVAHQFWLDIGSLGWWERLNQPLTNPYILRRAWSPGQTWSYDQDFNANQQHMQRIVAGLLNRCHRRVYVYSVQVNERGAEQRGPLLQAFQTLRKRAFAAQGGGRV